MREDMQQLVSLQPPALQTKNIPYVREVPAWPPAANRNIAFELQGVAFQGVRGWNADRFVYFATTRDDPTGRVVVKFTRSYFPSLHSFCADQGRAPKLLGYGTVPGEWQVVVMEYIEGVAKDSPQPTTKHRAKWSNDLKMLVTDFHNKGWVHGDLRVANFIIPAGHPENIMLVDFDWGGESGRVYYPTWMLNKDLIRGITTEGLRITKENDVRVLTVALERLERFGFSPEQPMDVD